MEDRYFVQCGGYPKLDAQMSIAGPMSADQVPEEIKKILERKEVTEVILFTNYGSYPGMTSYSKMKEES